MKLLIVDDSERVRGLIKRLVGGLCEEILEWADGEAAVAAYNEFHPDWVFMDIRMKKVDGLEATRQIMTAHRDARVIIITKYDDTRIRETACAVGACGYVLKEDLSVLREMLAAAPGPVAAGQQ